MEILTQRKKTHSKSDHKTNILGITWNQNFYWTHPQKRTCRINGKQEMEWCQVSIDTANKGETFQEYWQQEKKIAIQNTHTTINLWWYFRLQGYSFTDMWIRKINPQSASNYGPKPGVKTFIFEFALTNRNEMYTKLISA